MRYCADTWFILSTFDKDSKSIQLIRETKEGKARLVIPIVVFAEATKKLLQRGVPGRVIDLFWTGVEASEKVTIVNADRFIAQEASKVSFSAKVPLIDSFIAATCKLTGCNILLSGDTDYKLLAKKKYLKVQSW